MESDEAINQTSIDIYGNDLDQCADDAIEADYAMGDVRVYQNRISRSFMGISAQPSLGGPTYFLRNAMYNIIYEAFKLHNGTIGDVVLHNTIVKSGDAAGVYTDDSVSNAYFRNNLFIGGPGGSYGGYDSGSGRVIQIRSADASCSFDYDGVGSVSGNVSGQIGDTRFSDFSELTTLTSEVHAVQVDLSVFEGNVPFPDDPFADWADVTLSLAQGGAAIDRGEVIANINSSFTGDGPDLGAYEFGQTLPSYGPSGDSSRPEEPEPTDAPDPPEQPADDPATDDAPPDMATDDSADTDDSTDTSADDAPTTTDEAASTDDDDTAPAAADDDSAMDGGASASNTSSDADDDTANDDSGSDNSEAASGDDGCSCGVVGEDSGRTTLNVWLLALAACFWQSRRRR